MNTLLTLFTAQGLLGAFDTLYHHEFTERLPWRQGAARELRLHALRNLAYAVIFVSLGWLEWRGVWAWFFAALLVMEIIITLWDFVVEDQTRDLPASERITHTLLALGYGAILILLLPLVIGWAHQPSGLLAVDRGLWSWVMTGFAAAVMTWACRDAWRARALGRSVARPTKDLAALLPDRLSVLVTGGTGFIGTRLCEVLIAAGHEVTVLTRNKRKARQFRGRVTLIDSLDDLVDRARFDVVVNLAGEPVAGGRWTAARKRKLIESRVGTTGALVGFLERCRDKPGVLVSASAVGFYGCDPEAEFREDSEPRPAFGHDLCREWEDTARMAEPLGVRVCLVRIGLVLGTDGGALGQMLLPFEFGLGGPIGDGRQWMSWIHRDDLVGLILHAIAEPSLSGPINATAPAPVRNREFAATLGRVLRRPAVLPVPAFVLHRLLGQMAEELLLNGQKVLPARAEETGYRFTFTTLEAALSDILRPGRETQ